MNSVVLLSLVMFFSVLPKNSEETFWRLTTPRPTKLPSDPNAPIYRKLQIIPSPKKTAQLMLENFFDFHPASKVTKRSLVLEDIVFIMDGSGSVPKCEFYEGLKAFAQAIEMCEKPKDGNTYNCRHAAVTFSTQARVDFQFLPSAEARQKIRLIPYPDGSTNTQAGLAKAENLFLTGSRRFSKLKVLLLTDGRSNVDRHLTIPNAEKLKKNLGVQISVVAVGDLDTLAIQEMAGIASSAPEKHVFRIRKISDLVYIFEMALEKLNSGKLQAKPYQSPC
ncbi:integrin alpha-D-like [Dendronephthya gigantea]|uniref:integrin alpha-D-like n=1 Tax=Dendronephthya gigantea TaxID=151771 RepID=UPI00106AAF30|nr:integrin alpha-D-like [Dendronephthya gigantea]